MVRVHVVFLLTLAVLLGAGAVPDERRSDTAAPLISESFTPETETLAQMDEAPTQSIPYPLHSGFHDSHSEDVEEVFSAVVEAEGAPWVALRFSWIRLAESDYIEVVSMSLGTSRRYGADLVAGTTLTTVPTTGSSVEVKLFIGPGAQQSGFELAELLAGVAASPSPLPLKVCDGIDDRVRTSDDRVCRITSNYEKCWDGNASAGFCSCGLGKCVGIAPNRTCDGGFRDGQACGDETCAVGSTCEAFVGTCTAFVIERPSLSCWLTAGHCFLESAAPTHRTREDATFTTALMTCNETCTGFCQGGANDGIACGTNVECPGGACVGGPTCDGGANDTDPCGTTADCPGGSCTGGPGGGAVQGVGSLIAEYNVGSPHDWAVFRSNKKPAVQFTLKPDPDPDPNVITITGNGSDSHDVAGDADRGRFNNCQQTHTLGGATMAGDLISHFVDTEGGYSGAPIILDGEIWGIHTAGPAGVACTTPGNPNTGTYIDHNHLQDALILKVPAAPEWGLWMIGGMLLTAALLGLRERAATVA
jgi:hypothetical protein